MSECIDCGTAVTNAVLCENCLDDRVVELDAELARRESERVHENTTVPNAVVRLLVHA